jgi:hypothetical protein
LDDLAIVPRLVFDSVQRETLGFLADLTVDSIVPQFSCTAENEAFDSLSLPVPVDVLEKIIAPSLDLSLADRLLTFRRKDDRGLWRTEKPSMSIPNWGLPRRFLGEARSTPSR